MTADLQEKLAALYEAALFRPILGAGIVALSFATAMLEGVGLGFLLPIIELAQSSPSATDTSGVLNVFVEVYSFLGVPFVLEYLVLGVAGVMSIRFGLSFVSSWLQSILSLSYQRHLRKKLFDSILSGPIDYIDDAGSDRLLNSLITETDRASVIVMSVFSVAQVILRGLIYLVVAMILSPVLTLVAVVGLGISTVSVRYVLEPAYTAGDELADTNNRIQTISQTAVQGMRDVRLFNMGTELRDQLQKVLDNYVTVGVRLGRNKAALNNLNQFTNALVVFGLVYAGFTYTGLTLAELGVFLFAVFRLSPVLNQLNTQAYRIDGQIPHLLRVRSRCQELDEMTAPDATGDKNIKSVSQVEFDTVSFAYGDNEQVLDDISFTVNRGEKIAFVGPSGAGKSTIVSLLTRLQTPNSGQIRADGTPIEEFEVTAWRDRLAVVRQNPFLFNGTLRENVTVSNRDATQRDVERACEVARVTEFLSELPNGYETELGEDGVRLSGGQKQRVAIARALLKDADILILDEATSELDSNIERNVYNEIRSLEDQYATISIAHRLSTVSDADQIYTLVDGRITEVGSHEQLLEASGTYAELYATQS